MSKISIEGNASGSGTLTIAAPNTNSNYTLTLPESTGTMVVTGGAQTIEFAAGTVSAPSITTTGDTNTGIFFPAADTIAFSEGGTEAMRIDSSGRVGIGTSSPAGPLDVAGNDGITVRRVGQTNGFLFRPTATGDGVRFTQEGTGDRMTIDSSGNVGIGTSSPAVSGLEISRATGSATPTPVELRLTSSTSAADWSTTDPWGRLSFWSADTSASGPKIYGAIDVTMATTVGGSSDMSFYVNDLTGADLNKTLVFSGGSTGSTTVFYTGNGSERMRIDSSGNVGIGTTTPLGTAANRTVATVNGTSSAIVSLGVGGTRIGSYYADATKLILGTNTSTFLEFDTNGTERVRITSGGYFKASDTGSYDDATGAYNEFNQSAQARGLIVNATNGSFNSVVLDIKCSRSASADYYLIAGRSSGGSDTEFYITGAGNAYADGTWNNNGADYAEFFESANGQALTLGATVVLDGNKVREATEQDPVSAVIGVVRPKEPSKASMVVGNTAWNKWANKYLTDDFDRYIMEDHDVVEWEEQVLEKQATEAVEAVVDEDGNEVSPAIPAQEATYKTIKHSYESHAVPEGVIVPADATRKTHDESGKKFQHYQLNPAWNPDSEYVNRENRPEWNIIGLVGQVKVLKGQPTNDRWVKMRDVSETVEEWFIR